MVSEPTGGWIDFLQQRALSATVEMFEATPTTSEAIDGEPFTWSSTEELVAHLESFLRKITPDDDAAHNAAVAYAELVIAQTAASAAPGAIELDEDGDNDQ